MHESPHRPRDALRNNSRRTAASQLFIRGGYSPALARFIRINESAATFRQQRWASIGEAVTLQQIGFPNTVCQRLLNLTSLTREDCDKRLTIVVDAMRRENPFPYGLPCTGDVGDYVYWHPRSRLGLAKRAEGIMITRTTRRTCATDKVPWGMRWKASVAMLSFRCGKFVRT